MYGFRCHQLVCVSNRKFMMANIEIRQKRWVEQKTYKNNNVKITQPCFWVFVYFMSVSTICILYMIFDGLRVISHAYVFVFYCAIFRIYTRACTKNRAFSIVQNSNMSHTSVVNAWINCECVCEATFFWPIGGSAWVCECCNKW